MHKLAKALLTYETLTGSEIEDLINKNEYPKNKEDLKVEDELPDEKAQDIIANDEYEDFDDDCESGACAI